MIKISTSTKSDVYIHGAIIVSLLAALFLGFFFVYLPWSTNFGESITVPNLKGLTVQEMEEVLDQRNLSYEVTDCTYVANAKPYSVISQYPLANSKVKKGRKIYLTIITQNAPMIRLPKLTEMSLKSADQQMLMAGLERENLEYINDARLGMVLGVKYQGKNIEAGSTIAKGSKLVLVVGDGVSNVVVELPDVTNKPFDEANILLNGMGIQLGTVIYDPTSELEAGTVIKQNCANCVDNKIRAGQSVDLWVAGAEPQ
ncbi:MAG: PASTA domain-containing protein [Pseudarcicella sp.]|nr:PASTA domain-containing protein [Pseudarcicella sp.]MBP6410233.1 PASTA domain-containing protein [Pseudarcicella sp.]